MKEWNNHTLIYLKTHKHESIDELLKSLQDQGRSVAYFYEPDIGNKLTAIAIYGEDNEFEDYPLA